MSIAITRVYNRLRRGQGGALELQQGFVQRGEPKGHSRREGVAWLGRDGGRPAPCGKARRGLRDRLRGRPPRLDGFAWRDPDRSTDETPGSGGPRGLPRLATRRCHCWRGVCYRWWDCSDRMTALLRMCTRLE